MRRLFARLALTAAVCCAFAAAWPAPHATAAAAVQSAYWWRAQAAPTELPVAPQGVPAGGLYVASDPTGPEAVAALRTTVPAGVAPVTLSLVAVSSTGTGTALEACATSGWTATSGAGQWADRPTSTCTPAVRGVQSADGVTWFFPVTSLVRGTTLDVLVQPAGSGVFSDSFARPSADNITFPAPPVAAAAQPPAAAPEPAAVASNSQAAPSAPAITVPTQAAAAVPAVSAPAPQLAPTFAAPAATAANRSEPIDPRRAVFAVAAVLLVAGAWLLRTRGALTAAAGHPLAEPLRLRGQLAEHSLAGDPS
ncbi:MAG TPA: hypothetical protein VFH54_17375 [Mycobacteriales bacterium]|nr:hypothetical protein [Mycobacteriales bacterium]